jgi:hypothetical protein
LKEGIKVVKKKKKEKFSNMKRRVYFLKLETPLWILDTICVLQVAKLDDMNF